MCSWLLDIKQHIMDVFKVMKSAIFRLAFANYDYPQGHAGMTS